MKTAVAFSTMLRVGACIAGLLLLAGCSSPVAEKTVYSCPMHPQVTSDKPGDCTICGMRLVPKAPVSEVAGAVAGLAPVSISVARQKEIGLGVSAVEMRRMSRTVRTSARITPDETRLHHVTPKIAGWVEDLFVNAVGQMVRRGQPLMTIYSPELLATQEEYLSALSAARRLGVSSIPGVASQGGRDLLGAARRRLELWDISEAQIRALEDSGKAQRAVTLYSPASGFVSQKSVAMGHNIMPGEVLLTVSDLSAVWAESDIYESDLRFVKVGMSVALTLSSLPGKSFPGKISFLNPFLDPQTRTLKARLVVPNPELLLKPEMYGEMNLSFDLGERLAVPSTAVLRTGQKSLVFRQDDPATLTPVEVSLGERSGEFYEVLSGLKPGDRVVTSANFLVDSESALKSALGAVGNKETANH